MFSHREHGFPTGGTEAKDKDQLRAKAVIWRMICVGSSRHEQRALSVIPAIRYEDFQGISAYPSDEDFGTGADRFPYDDFSLLIRPTSSKPVSGALPCRGQLASVNEIAVGIPVAWYPPHRPGQAIAFIARIDRVRNSASGYTHSRTDWNAGVYVQNLPLICLCLRPQGLIELSGCRPHGAR